MTASPRSAAAPSKIGARRGRGAAALLVGGALLSAGLPGSIVSLAPEAAAQSFGAPDRSGAFLETDDDAAREAVRAIVERGQHQMELPPRPEPEPPQPQRDPIEPFELSETAQTALIALLVIVVLVIIAQLARQRIAPSPKGAAKPAVLVRSAPEDEPTAEDLRDAEAAALAAAEQGRWDHAIHLLLLGAIGRLRERDAKATARSLTSREILARHFQGPNRAEARQALAALVGAVEISLFGGQAADRSGFERCLTAYRALRQSLSGRAPIQEAAA
ncbi:MAG: hypothetical protein AAGM38_09825 [Pseudomonadota bacterium]